MYDWTVVKISYSLNMCSSIGSLHPRETLLACSSLLPSFHDTKPRIYSPSVCVQVTCCLTFIYTSTVNIVHNETLKPQVRNCFEKYLHSSSVWKEENMGQIYIQRLLVHYSEKCSHREKILLIATTVCTGRLFVCHTSRLVQR